MPSPQTLSEDDRRIVAAWAARFAAGRASGAATSPAAKAAELADPGRGGADEIAWQIAHTSEPVRAALLRLPLLGEDSSGPLGAGLLASGVLGQTIRTIQSGLAGSG